MASPHRFGGPWTEEKLTRLTKYLNAYMTIMKKHPYFRVAYIDAFAGTGYVDSEADEEDRPLLQSLLEPESRAFVKGSAVKALEINPPFHNYIFIDLKKKHVTELENLKLQYPDLASRIRIVHGEANDEVKRLCRKNWKTRRAVLFLDPYGMQVEWSTLKAIAETKAIDLWILFPWAIAVNRMLPRSGEISPSWKRRLDLLFGSEAWIDRFYVKVEQEDLFGPRPVMKREANLESIKEYFVERLKEIFEGVAENPLPLTTADGRPLYLLCFAAGNPKVAAKVVKIAQDILKA